MVILSDNDVVLKLAAFDLLEAAIALLKVPPEEVLVLDAAPHQVERSPRLHARYGSAAVGRALSFLQHATPITERTSLDAESELLAGSECISESKMLLFAATRDLAQRQLEFIFLTADWQALRCLAATPLARSIYERLRGRVLCLEEVLRALVHEHEFQAIRDGIVPAMACDHSTAIAFNGGAEAQRDEVLERLDALLLGSQGGSQGGSAGVGLNWLLRLPTPLPSISAKPVIST